MATNPYNRATMYGRYSLLDTNNPQKPYYEGWDGYSKTNLQRPVRLSDIFLELPDAQAQADDRAVLDGANERYVRALRDPKLMEQLELEELARRGANRQRMSEPQTSSWNWNTSGMKSYGNSEYDQVAREKANSVVGNKAQERPSNSGRDSEIAREMVRNELERLNRLREVNPSEYNRWLKNNPRLRYILETGQEAKYFDEIYKAFTDQKGIPRTSQVEYNAEGKRMGTPAKAPAPASNINNFAGNINGSASDPLKPEGKAEVNRVPMDNKGALKMYGDVANTRAVNPKGAIDTAAALGAAGKTGLEAWRALGTPEGRSAAAMALPAMLGSAALMHLTGTYGPSITEAASDMAGAYISNALREAYKNKMNLEYNNID